MPPVFGLRTPFQGHNIVWARFFVLFQIAGRIRRARGLREKLLAPFRPPEWDPDGNHDVTTLAAAQQPTKIAASGLARVYAVAQHLVVLAIVALFVMKWDAVGVGARIAIAAWLWASLGVVGALLDARTWAVKAEAVRWAVAVAGVVLFRLI